MGRRGDEREYGTFKEEPQRSVWLELGLQCFRQEENRWQRQAGTRLHLVNPHPTSAGKC